MGNSVCYAVTLTTQLLLRAIRVSAVDAPPILEERQARERQARRETGGNKTRAERETGREDRAARKSSKTGAGGEEAGGEARGTGRTPEAGRGGGVRERGPRGTGRPRADGRADEGRIREAHCRLPRGRGRICRGVPIGPVQGRDPRPRGLARLPRAGGVRAGCAPEGSQP